MAVWCCAVLLTMCVRLSAGKRQNIALNKPAWMSTSWQPFTPASQAVDGAIHPFNWGKNIHTDINQQTAWWKVDLQTVVSSPQVNIYFRMSYKSRRDGIQLYTSLRNSSSPKEGNLCYSVRGCSDGTDIPDVLNVTCPGNWRYLTVYTEKANNKNGPVLDFAEVQVWVTNIETSEDYQQTATQTTAPTPAMLTPGVMTFPTGHECGVGQRYGASCMKSCADRQCKLNSSCDVKQGRCVGGCRAGWSAADCTQECVQGMEYGANCEGTCSTRMCEGGLVSCPRDTGRCEAGCKSGWTGEDCTQELKRQVPVSCPVYPANISVLDICVTIMVGVLLILVLGLCLCLLKQGKLPWSRAEVQTNRLIDVNDLADVNTTEGTNSSNTLEDIL
ncbi:uncharacterized protein LOC124279860 isoform X2 [Haliotis rubra]|uniref:uncharacterized protein LOC124279860 isoform X2 n=1 Tax=Haliotis rubra TaxID=36100 RepID=UPI001EE57C34|nr:uncharacterized protein LOC124279860 isoform X2 [Haliotis rubra]